jgi:hypothetical protein
MSLSARSLLEKLGMHGRFKNPGKAGMIGWESKARSTSRMRIENSSEVFRDVMQQFALKSVFTGACCEFTRMYHQPIVIKRPANIL